MTCTAPGATEPTPWSGTRPASEGTPSLLLPYGAPLPFDIDVDRSLWTGCGNVDAQLGQIIDALRTATRVVVATGAGMSRESGIPTFREAQTGLWARFDPTELATEAAFRSAPARVFGWYAWRRSLVERARPHAGYAALVRLGRVVPMLTVVTQNVDGLHRRAGSTGVIELHGALDRWRCLDGGHPIEVALVPPIAEAGEVEPPACRTCGSPARPDVVWFGEELSHRALSAAWSAARASDVMLVVGTSGLVYPAAALPDVARDAGAIVIEINPELTELSHDAHYTVRGTAGEVLPHLVEALEKT